MEIDNTTKRMRGTPEAALILGDAGGGGWGPDVIERQERDGQRQLVNSDRLPVNTHGTDADFEALGFTFGEPDASDPLFRQATMPPGWKRQATDHSMGSVITDEHGRERVSIFYKAAFYDRSAHMTLTGLHWYVTKHVEYGGPLLITGEWATREAVLAAMGALRDEQLNRAAEFAGYAADEKRGDAANREACAGHAREYEAKAALYEAAMAKLSGAGDAAPEAAGKGQER